MFNIEFSSHSERFLKKLDKEIAARIIGKIEALSNDPFPSDVKRVVNRKDKIFRIRVGDYRIQYSVIYSKQLVFVFDIDKRPKAYLQDVFTSVFKDGLLNLSWGNGTDDLTSDFTAMTNRAGFFRVDAEVNFE